MKQSLAVDRPGQRGVDSRAGLRATEGLSVQSISTSGYCRAGTRLHLNMIAALTRETGRQMKLTDGMRIPMPDIAQNQARYPQSRSQATGVGFPLAGLVETVCPSIDAHATKGPSEHDLFRYLHATLRARNILLADALNCCYIKIATLKTASVNVLLERLDSRMTDFRCGRCLESRDHLTRWSKPETRARWMSQGQY